MHDSLTASLPEQTQQERLAAALAALQRRFGPHAVQMGADYWLGASLARSEPLSTGSLGLDLLLGGLPSGKITEIAGSEGSCTDLFGLSILAACQRANGLAVLIDPESSLEPDRLAALAIDTDRLILAYPTTALAAWTILTALCRADAARLILVASIPAVLALPSLGRGSLSYPLSGLPRRLIHLSNALRGRSVSVVLLNRTTGLQDERDVLDDRLETVGGYAIAQASAVRIGLGPYTLITPPDQINPFVRTQAIVLKHYGRSCAPSIPLTIGTTGLCRSAELVALGLQLGCVSETPLGLVFQQQGIGRSIDRAAQALMLDQDLASQIEASIRSSWLDLYESRTPSCV